MTDLAHPDRLAKAAPTRPSGGAASPARGGAGGTGGELIAGRGAPDAPGPRHETRATIAGRLLGLRDFGKLVFAPLRDRTGRLQVGLQKARLEDWWDRRKDLDGGDLVAFEGTLGFTQKGEPTLWADAVHLQSKASAPRPEKWRGLAAKELRYRRRYQDLWVSDGVLEVFVKRSRILSLIRGYLESEGYLEVETPTLHPIAGGATARPFVTHHNALGMDLFLRIAPELYLKRLIVGGMERVFEVSRNFRNEGLSLRHNPEFTMLELYEAQADYRRMMELVERMFELLAREVCGGREVGWHGKSFSFEAPFARRRYADLFREHAGCEFDDEPAVRAKARELKLHNAEQAGPGEFWKLMNDVFEATVEDHLLGPVFVTDYPVQICPLAKASPDDPRFAERFEVFVDGMELGNAFSELNDPVEQERRFAEQVASQDPEAPGQVDVDYVQALEVGMPPTGGLGIGIDRLVMVLCDQDSIRDVLLFPAMRPVVAHEDEARPASSADGGS